MCAYAAPCSWTHHFAYCTRSSRNGNGSGDSVMQTRCCLAEIYIVERCTHTMKTCERLTSKANIIPTKPLRLIKRRTQQKELASERASELANERTGRMEPRLPGALSQVEPIQVRVGHTLCLQGYTWCLIHVCVSVCVCMCAKERERARERWRGAQRWHSNEISGPTLCLRESIQDALVLF